MRAKVRGCEGEVVGRRLVVERVDIRREADSRQTTISDMYSVCVHFDTTCIMRPRPVAHELSVSLKDLQPTIGVSLSSASALQPPGAEAVDCQLSGEALYRHDRRRKYDGKIAQVNPRLRVRVPPSLYSDGRQTLTSVKCSARRRAQRTLTRSGTLSGILPVCHRREGSRMRSQDSPYEEKPSRARGKDLLGGLYCCDAAMGILLGLDLLYDLRVEGGSGENRPACIYWGQSGRAGARDVAAATAATVWMAQGGGR